MRHRHVLGLALCLAAGAAAGCTTNPRQLFVGAGTHLLADVTGPSALRERFELIAKPNGDGALRMVREYERERPFCGFMLDELGKRDAEQRGLQPFAGLLVLGTYANSAAAKAGVAAGDVLTAFGGAPVQRLAQFAAVEARAKPGSRVVAQLLRGGKAIEATLEVAALRERVTDPQEVPLERPPAETPYAGVHLRAVPGAWAERMFGETGGACVLITGVEVGSPAWLAGFRGGDRIEAVDGGPVPPLRELSRRFASHGAAGIPLTLRTVRWLRGPVDGEPVADRHEAAIALEEYAGLTEIWLPLVLHVESGVHEDRWSLGPLGLLASNANAYVADPWSRTTNTMNVFDALFGLVRVRSAPGAGGVRLFWFLEL